MLQRKKYSEVLDEWFLYQKRYVRESTYSTYFHHIESHIKPFFKGKRIGRITHGDIQEFLDYKIDNGRLDGKGGLSYKTVKYMLNIIKLSMMYAIEKNYIKNINLNFKINLTQDKCW